MKFLFFITSFFLFQEFAFCQNIDSLLNVLEHKMEKQKVFDKAKENQIKRVLEGSFKTNAFEEKIRVNNELFKLDNINEANPIVNTFLSFFISNLGFKLMINLHKPFETYKQPFVKG